MLVKIIVVTLFSMSLVACGGQGTGNAPTKDNSVVEQPIINDNDNVFKYGETVTTGAGWEVSYDSVDAVEAVTLSNGWDVEVMYE